MASGSSRSRRRSISDYAELSSLAAEEGTSQSAHLRSPTPQPGVWREEAGNMALLVVLYMMQGVPLGLTSGAMPFLLQARASYTQIGIFSVASYPYSFKLFWSPIVDSLYSLTFGRRKSWVVPIQLCSAALLLVSARWAEARLGEADVVSITVLFFALVMLAATQDIAVDGWALTLLSRKNVGYASTCQTVGMNIGYFTSFTLFLALNDAQFCNRYFRSHPSEEGMLLLSAYMRFWGWIYLAITAIVAIFKRESNFRALEGEEVEELKETPQLHEAYRQLWAVVRLPAMQRFTVVLLLFRLAMLPAEQAAPLKLLEKGVSKEALAGLVLLEFPCELVSALVAGKWATGAAPLRPWLLGYRLRLFMAAVVTALVAAFPLGTEHLSDYPWGFAALAASGLVTSFTSTFMFTALGSFFNRISDPDMGGAYLTLLNTIANMGLILPKLGVFWLMDALSERTCEGLQPVMSTISCPRSQAHALGVNECTILGGKCVLSRDGFTVLSYSLVGVGVLLGLYFQSAMHHLQHLPIEAWRAKRRRL